MVTLSIPNFTGLGFATLVAGLALALGHYLFSCSLNRTQAYVWGVASLLAGYFIYCWLARPEATSLEIFVAICTITVSCGGLVKIFYLVDRRFNFKGASLDTTPDREKINQLEKTLAEKDTRIYQLELLRAQLKAENERLNGTPLAVLEWQRQEVVAALGAALDIMGEVSTKTGIAYGHMASIQGVFVNKGALNLSAKQRQSISLAGSTGRTTQAGKGGEAADSGSSN